MSKVNLEVIYRQNPEPSIIEYLAMRKNISQRKAMDIYYKSRLSEQIQAGQHGVENLDYKYLTEDLIENEPELFTE